MGLGMAVVHDKSLLPHVSRAQIVLSDWNEYINVSNIFC